MSNKKILAEQVLFRLYGGMPDVAAPVQLEDVYKALEQKVNSQFALQQFTVNLPNAGTIPNNLAIGTYEDVAVTSNSNGTSKSTLPVMPITLPRNAGIQEIRPQISSTGNTKILGNPFVPLQFGQRYLLDADKLLNSLFGQVSYEPSGMTVTYKKDVTLLGVTKVDMKLVVLDMSQYSETDPLPIPSDAEDMLVNELVKQFSPVQPESGAVNNYTTAEQNK